MKTLRNFVLAFVVLVGTLRMAFAAQGVQQAEQQPTPSSVSKEDIVALQETLAAQQKQIEVLREELRRGDEAWQQTQQILAKMQAALAGTEGKAAALEARSTERAGTVAALQAYVADLKANMVNAALTTQEDQRRTGAVESTLKDVVKNLNGFRFGGDFRFRLDAQLRSGNEVAGPLQNVRSRYRLRLNVDKDLDSRFGFHLQLSTAPFNNGITNDQDMAGTVAKHPFSIAEASITFRPNVHLALRGGRMVEVFADNMRFLWDDDVRFNGFEQAMVFPVSPGFLGLKRVELRAAEYLLSNPNIAILSPSSPFVKGGFQPGRKVRDAMLFHPGFILTGNLGSTWTHQITGDIQIYRYPNQIQLASTLEGSPVLVSNALGLALSGLMGGTGNATTTPGGAVYAARNFQIMRLVYRLERKGLTIFDRELPAWFDFQLSRNLGTSKLRDAFMASANLGAIKEAGDVRFLYQFAIKDANALISQFTDDDLGTGTGVNIAVHAVRFDLGLTRFLQWQNLLFIQTERRPSNPAAQFFVPLQRGANTTFRYLGQLAFSF